MAGWRGRRRAHTQTRAAVREEEEEERRTDSGSAGRGRRLRQWRRTQAARCGGGRRRRWWTRSHTDGAAERGDAGARGEDDEGRSAAVSERHCGEEIMAVSVSLTDCALSRPARRRRTLPPHNTRIRSLPLSGAHPAMALTYTGVFQSNPPHLGSDPSLPIFRAVPDMTD